ncbi:suppressor of fused domain protein [Aneurinibacillus sp. REN35]|uniref:suppressor of fused domain protein n=1 Tax=Aneurinibacillus sp. REN35 TaxID=3237286 RepID=UPI003527757A
MEPTVLIEESSPLCPMVAFVEESNQCVYFYLMEHAAEERSLRAVWVCNYGKAPAEISTEDMERGLPPRLPASLCAHPEGADALDPDKLRIIWFEEGDAAALLYEEEILAIIPGWGGNREYPGYARDCIDFSPYAMPLGSPAENRLFDRVERARQFFQSWDEESWPRLQESLLTAIEGRLGSHDRYYAIDGGDWPPKAMVTMEQDDITYAVTLGVSAVPQPLVEQYTEEPELWRRIELALSLPTSVLQKNESGILEYLSGLPLIPWHQITYLGHTHTIDCDAFSVFDERFTAVMLVHAPPSAPEIPFAPYRGDRVCLLWVVPITAEEHAYAMQNGGTALLQKVKPEAADTLWLCNGKVKFDV